MPILFAAFGVALALFNSYWNFQSIVLYGCVGYLLGVVMELRKSQRKLADDLELLRQNLRNLVLKSMPETTSSAPEKKPEAARPESMWKPDAPATPPPAQPMAPPPPVVNRPAPPPPQDVPALPERPRYIPKPEDFEEKPRKPFLPEWFVGFFTKGNLFAKVGAILLLFGISFLIKLVAEQGFFPLEFRLLASGAVAVVLMVFGWRLRNKNAVYAQILQGTGFGVFYLTVFGSFRIWNLLPAQLAFGMVVGATFLFSMLSVIQNSKVLAALAVAGGFSAPVLISTGSGNHVALFSYYALLNLGILAISKYRPWRELNLLGFIFTYVVGTAWGAKFYQPQHFASVEPFLLFHFLLYVTVSLYFSKLQLKLNKDFFVDAVLVFGVPIATFALQSRLVHDMRYGMAISAAAFGLFYVGLATVMFRRQKEETRLMVESFLAAGICFTILAVPFAVNNAWTSAVWALEGAFLVWVSIRQNRPIGRYFGMGMQVLASLAFFTKAFPMDILPAVANAWFLGSVMIFVSCFFIGFQLFRRAAKVSKTEADFAVLFVVGAVFWWVFAIYNEIPRAVYGFSYPMPTEGFEAAVYPLNNLIYHLRLLLIGVSFAIFYGVARFLAWPLLSFAAYGLFGVFFYSVPLIEEFMYGRSTPERAFLNPFYMSMMILTLSAFIISRSMFKAKEKLAKAQQHAHWLFLIAGYVWWLIGNRVEIGTLIARTHPELSFHSNTILFQSQHIFLVFLSASALAFWGLARFLNWRPLGAFRLLLTGFASIYFIEMCFASSSKLMLEGWGWAAWPSVLAVQFFLLWRAEVREGRPFNAYQHLSAFYLVSALLVRESYLLAELYIDPNSIWRWVCFFGTAGVLAIIPLAAPAKLWPFGVHRSSYLKAGIAPHLILLIVGTQFLNFTNPGNPAPLPYIPIVNPLGILIMFSILVLVFSFLKVEKIEPNRRVKRGQFWVFIGVLVFTTLTMGLVRAIVHYKGLPWDLPDIAVNRTVQSSLTIFWGLLSLAVMVFSHRKGWRGLWVAGTILLVVVVGKVFLLDLKERNTMERVVSFIGSGILLLLTGYFAPIPPKSKEKKDA